AYPLEAVEQNVRAVEAATGRFLAEHSAELTADERRLLERVVALWPAMMRTRSETTDHLTLVHGDFHLMGNVFQPPPGQTRLKVIDWSEVKPGRGPHDLAYALVSAASPDRAARDRRLLKRYVTALEAHGVRGYGLDAAYLDYRFSLLTNLFQSVFQDSPRWLRVTLDAVRDHDAEAVLD
ncbi:MAG: phosphotransferase, partial [Caulobacteraceae bacterium]